MARLRTSSAPEPESVAEASRVSRPGGAAAAQAQIRQRGFEPAIWVAPFVAESEATVFRKHADWFVKDADGASLRSDRVTFGGWRRGPWYVLDGTHPAVQNHFEQLFKTMRGEWGCGTMCRER